MPAKKTYYEIMGIPRNATPELIKRRYRQLARKHHPDVAEDKAAAKAAFIEISEAYQTLSNPDKRTIYDSNLDAELFRVQPRPASPGTSRPNASTRSGSRPSGWTTRTSPGDIRGLIAEAQAAFVQGQFRRAELLAKGARGADRRNLQAHVILGDIYRIQGQVDDAIAMYTVAAQLDPRNKELAAKLNRLIRQQGRVSDAIVTHQERGAALKIGLSLMGFSMNAFMFIMLALSPGDPILWLKMNLPMIGTWSTTLITVLLITGALTGFLLSVNESVDPLDDELVFKGVHASGIQHTNYPIGILLVIFNLFSFYGAVGMYTVIGLVQDCLSKSVYKSFVATFALVLIASLFYAPGHDQVLIWGGNVAFPAVLFGWAIGDMFRPGW